MPDPLLASISAPAGLTLLPGAAPEARGESGGDATVPSAWEPRKGWADHKAKGSGNAPRGILPQLDQTLTHTG